MQTYPRSSTVIVPISAHGSRMDNREGAASVFVLGDSRVSIVFYTPHGNALHCSRTSPSVICNTGRSMSSLREAQFPVEIFQGGSDQLCPNYILSPDDRGEQMRRLDIRSAEYTKYGHPYSFRSGAAICNLRGGLIPVFDIAAYAAETGGDPTLADLIIAVIDRHDSMLIQKGIDISATRYVFHCLFCRS